MDRGAWQAIVMGLQKVGHNWATNIYLLSDFVSYNIAEIVP